MNISFTPLSTTHFPLLLKWLETPHVKAWWDDNIQWTPELIEQKYSNYVQGFKRLKLQSETVEKPMHAYIILYDGLPIGYIQYYNKHDFPQEQGYETTELPDNCAAIDWYIGELDFIGKGIGTQALTLFVDNYVFSKFDYVFTDSETKNISAIRAYEKTGFKEIKKVKNGTITWMMKGRNMRNQPLLTIQKLIRERYPEAKTVFWAGSVAKNHGTEASDLDLIVVYERIPNAYREAFIYDQWPIDAFVHDTNTLHYFFEESRTSSGIPGLISMILEGLEVTNPTDFSKNIKTIAQKTFEAGPHPWSKYQIDKERFLITDILEDIKFPVSREEQIASTARLYEDLLRFYFRAQNKWSASGKSIIRYLQQDNPKLALEFTQCFENIFQTRNTAGLEELVKKILAPFGGLIWDGFTSNAPKKL